MFKNIFRYFILTMKMLCNNYTIKIKIKMNFIILRLEVLILLILIGKTMISLTVKSLFLASINHKRKNPKIRSKLITNLFSYGLGQWQFLYAK